MKTLLKPILLLPIGLLMISCVPDENIMLFNGEDLDNWLIVPGTTDVDPEELFYAEDGMIHTSGIPNGYIRTRETYSNYKLHLEWRWTDEPTNSGVLLHVQGEDKVWPLCIECQLMHGHAGDVVLINKGAGITIRDSTYRVTSDENPFVVIERSEEGSENPPGEWNSYDITSSDGNLEVVVNGILQNSGTGMTLTEGHIAIQSEGSPMQFRNISLRPLEPEPDVEYTPSMILNRP